jgi:hypothetical protein
MERWKFYFDWSSALKKISDCQRDGQLWGWAGTGFVFGSSFGSGSGVGGKRDGLARGAKKSPQNPHFQMAVSECSGRRGFFVK